MRCPVIEEAITRPCHLASCRYHVDYLWSQNCLLHYLQDQGVESLSTHEIAFLYRRSTADVKKLLDAALTKLRTRAIAHDIPERRFRYFGAALCCVCQEPAESSSKNLTIPTLDAVYCSKECRDSRHPRVVELEAEHGLPIAKILEWTFRRYRSLSLAEQALGMPRWLVYETCERYLDRPLEAYFDSLKSVQRSRQSKLLRRTWHPPHWVDAVVGAKISVINTLVRQHGPVSRETEIRVESLRSRLHYLCG